MEKIQPAQVDGWFDKQTDQSSEIELSVVVPAYNEELRLPPTLIEMIDYLDARRRGYEIIVVDDGSTDGTSGVVGRFEKIRPQVRLIKLARNCGKGHAVRTGMLNAKGKMVLFADADGSTRFQDLELLEREISSGAGVAFGSRALASQSTRVKAIWYRKIIGRVFNFFVNTLLLPGVKDTQCGFKMFSREVAESLFSKQTIDGFNFDVEVLYLARKSGVKSIEVPVNWRSMPGSKVNLALDSAKMLLGLFVIRWKHAGFATSG